MIKVRNWSVYGLCAGAALLVSGCVSILPDAPPAPRVFVLQSSAVAGPALPKTSAVLSVARPNTPRGLSGRDLAWRRGVELAFVNGAAWEGQTPELLHNLLVDTLDRQRVARAVVRVADGSLADYELRWDLVRFEIEEVSPREQVARFEATVRMLNAVTREVITSERIEESTPLAERGATAAADGLTRTANAAATRIADWAARTISGGASSRQPNAASSNR